MAVRESVEIDLDRVDRLIQEQEAELEPKHRASIAYREIARRHVAGGVASSWQASPPHAIFIERGDGSRIWDIDGNEYVDYHLGYGAMVVGHAHPAIVEAIERQVRNGTHFAQPTKHLDAIGANLAGTLLAPAVAVLQLGDRGDARGRAADARRRPGATSSSRSRGPTTATTTR